MRHILSNPPRQKGTAWETAIVNWLSSKEVKARRKTLSGSQDKGDIEIDGLDWLVIEAKNAKAMSLAQWVKEANQEAINSEGIAGVVWHHRAGKASPADGYVTMDGQTFLTLLFASGILKED